MQWLSTILVSLTVWFATYSYFQAQIADLQKEEAVKLQIQAQTNTQKFYEDFAKEKERYEAFNKEWTQARHDIADTGCTSNCPPCPDCNQIRIEEPALETLMNVEQWQSNYLILQARLMRHLNFKKEPTN